MRIVLLFGAILAAGCSYAHAQDSCDKAFQDLKHLEEQHPVDSVEAMVDLRKGNHCSDVVLNFEDQVDANAQAEASYAKTFVAACANDTSKAGELAYYNLDAVLNPHPSTLRQRCKASQ